MGKETITHVSSRSDSVGAETPQLDSDSDDSSKISKETQHSCKKRRAISESDVGASKSQVKLHDLTVDTLVAESTSEKKRVDAEINAKIRDKGIDDLFLTQHESDHGDEDSHHSDSPSDNAVLDCARRPQKTSTTRPRGQGAKRKSYTDKEYKMIINASDNTKRRIIADAIEMPWKTALAIMNRYQKTGKVHDKRHERLGTKAKRTAGNDPYSAANRGRWGKLGEKYQRYMFHLVHFNCAMFATDLMDLVNREIIRDFLLEHEVFQTTAEQATAASTVTDALEHGIVLGIQPLSAAERHIGGPLDTTPFEQHEEYKKFCELNVIRSTQTIRNHLKESLYTRKSIIIEKATANTPKATRQRLEHAIALRALIDGKAGKVFLLFQGEMPFYLNQHRKQGLSKKGERAVYRGPPTSNMSFRTQLSMAVHPTLGVFAAKQYNPKKVEYTDKNGKKKSKWKSGYGKKEFEDFLHLLMTEIMSTLEDDNSDGYDEAIGARIYLFYDGAPEHGRDAVSSMINRFPRKQEFDELLVQHGCTFLPVKLSPNSPHLNLCEYYNRMLRVHATRERNMPEVHKVLQCVQGTKGIEVGNIIQTRVETIHGCIDRALQHVCAHPQALGNYNNFSGWVQKIIDRRGYLNYYEPM